MRRGLNHDGYRGERIEIASVVRETVELARAVGWQVEQLLPLPTAPIVALHRGGVSTAKTPLRRIYLSAGIHGDEPAGPLALRRMIERDRWPKDLELWICPCLNPTGFAANRRENADGLDLNRDYRHRQSAEVRAHTDWLDRQSGFDLALCLHEDWEAGGFYLYELNRTARPSPAEQVLAAVTGICPIDHSPEIDGRASRAGIIRPALQPAARPQWPEALYLIEHLTGHCFTLESPSDFALSVRVAAHERAIDTLLGISESSERSGLPEIDGNRFAST